MLTSDEINALMMQHQQAYLQQDLSAAAFPQLPPMPFSDELAASGTSALGNIGLPMAVFGGTMAAWGAGVDPFRMIPKAFGVGRRAGGGLGGGLGRMFGGGFGRGVGRAAGTLAGGLVGAGAALLGPSLAMDAAVNFTAGNIMQGAFDMASTQSFLTEISTTGLGNRFGSQSILSQNWGDVNELSDQAYSQFQSMGKSAGLDVGGMIGIAGSMVSSGMVQGNNPQELMSGIRQKLQQVQELSQALDLTLEESMGVLSQIQQSGVSSSGQLNLGLRAGTLSSLSGIGMPTLLQAGSQAAQMGLATGVSSDRGFAIGMNNLSSVGVMSGLGMVDRDLLQMTGGPQGLAQLLTQAQLGAPATQGGYNLLQRMVDDRGSGIDFGRMVDLEVGRRGHRRRVDPYALPDLQEQFVENERGVVLGQVQRIQDRYGEGSRRANEHQYRFLSEMGIGDPRMQEAYLENLRMEPVMRSLEAAQSIVDDQQLAHEAQQRASNFFDRLFSRLEEAIDSAAGGIQRFGANVYRGLQGVGQDITQTIEGLPQPESRMVGIDVEDLRRSARLRSQGTTGMEWSRAEAVQAARDNPQRFDYASRGGTSGTTGFEYLIGIQDETDVGTRLIQQGYSPEYLRTQGIYIDMSEEEAFRQSEMFESMQPFRDTPVGSLVGISARMGGMAQGLTEGRRGRTSRRNLGPQPLEGPEGMVRAGARTWVTPGEGTFRAEELLRDVADDPQLIAQTVEFFQATQMGTDTLGLNPSAARNRIIESMVGVGASEEERMSVREEADVVLGTLATPEYRDRYGAAVGPAGGSTVQEITAALAQSNAVGALLGPFASARGISEEELGNYRSRVNRGLPFNRDVEEVEIELRGRVADIINSPASRRNLETLGILGLAGGATGTNPVRALNRQAADRGVGSITDLITGVISSTMDPTGDRPRAPWEVTRQGTAEQIADTFSSMIDEGAVTTEAFAEMLFWQGFNVYDEKGEEALTTALGQVSQLYPKATFLPESDELLREVTQQYNAYSGGQTSEQRFQSRYRRAEELGGTLNMSMSEMSVLSQEMGQTSGAYRTLIEARESSIAATRGRVLREDQQQFRTRFARGVLEQGTATMRAGRGGDVRVRGDRTLSQEVERAQSLAEGDPFQVLRELESRGVLETFVEEGGLSSELMHLYRAFEEGISGDVIESLMGPAPAGADARTFSDVYSFVSAAVVSAGEVGGLRILGAFEGMEQSAGLLAAIREGRLEDVSRNEIVRRRARESRGGDMTSGGYMEYAEQLQRELRSGQTGGELQEIVQRHIEALNLDPNQAQNLQRELRMDIIRNAATSIDRRLENLTGRAENGVPALRVSSGVNVVTETEDLMSGG